MSAKTSTVPILACVLAVAAHATSAAERAERRLLAMGTELSVVIESERREQALEASERAIRALRVAERRLSTWDPGSEMSRFNAAPAGVPTRISPLLARDLTDALHCGEETGGAFTPGLGRLVQAWRLRSGGRRPADGEIDALLPALGPHNLVVEAGTATRLDEHFVVEEGAFGKGVGLDDAMATLAAGVASSAVLDLGGQVAVWGATSLSVGIVDPRDRERVVLRLQLSSGSVATTGNSERGIVVDGARLGHVLDPATGRPAADFGSITVWAARATRADCLSTGLYVMGPGRALAWAASHPDVGVVALETREGDLLARATANLRERLRPADDGVELRFSAETNTNRPGETISTGPDQ